MWRTPRGERALQGAEARLLRELIGYVYDDIDLTCRLAEVDYEAGVPVFDRLQPSQQLALLAEVGEALLGNCQPPELTAVREATIAVLFHELRMGIEFEIDCELHQPDWSWRELLLAAYIERCPGDDDLPEATWTDLGEWVLIADVFSETLLWDADWEMEDLFVDKDPDASDALKMMLRVSDEYFRDVPPDPTDDQLIDVRVRLNELTGCTHPT